MTQTLDNRGAHISFSTRAGLDVRFEVGVDGADGLPMDLTGYVVIAVLNDGKADHVLPTSLIGTDTIAVRIEGALTATLPSVSQYSVELQTPGEGGLRASLVYGSVLCDRTYP